jgi:hypothetical protein
MPENEKQHIQIPADLQEGVSYETEIGVGDNVAPDSVIDIAKQFKRYQIVQASGHDTDTELLTSKLMIKSPGQFVNFPLSSILDPLAACEKREQELRIFNRVFTRGKEKAGLLADIQSLILQMTKSESITSDIQLAVDEMFTNAIYNAPYVEFAKNGPGRPRNEADAKTDLLRPGELFLGRNQSRIVVGCIDGYGSLNPECLITRIRKCYEQGAGAAINMGPGGAGLGMFMVYQSSCSIYVGVSTGQRTVICCAFSLERRAKVRSVIPKNLHLSTSSENEEKNGLK